MLTAKTNQAAQILKLGLTIIYSEGLVTHKRKSLDVDLRLIATDSFCVFDLLLYVMSRRWSCRDVGC